MKPKNLAREMDEETAKKLHKKLKVSAFKHGFGSDADEIAQAVLVKMLEGRHRHATCDQAVIDYLRAEYGRKGEPGYDLKQAFTLKRLQFEEHLSKHEGGFGNYSSSRSIAFNLLRYFRGNERAMYLLTHYWGFNETEVGNLFGVSPSRVSQRLEGIQKRLRSRIAAEGSRERKRKMEEILHPKKTYYARDMEQRPNQEMAFGQSWQMERFNEESF